MSKILVPILSAAALAAALLAIPAAWSADWKPDRNVELIVSSGPGGGNDRTVRTIQRIFQDRRLIDVTTTILNKLGGGGALAWIYLNQHRGDGHYLSTSIPTLLTNYIMGKSDFSYKDVTPVVQLFSEYIAFMVRTDSPIRNSKDLLEKLARDPEGMTITVGASVGNHNHIALALLMQSIGISARRVRTVVFKSSAEAYTAVLGGHVDLVISPVSTAKQQLENGRMRLLAVTSPQRLPGVLSSVPTWKEYGANVVIANWRGVIGPKDMSQEQTRYWEQVFARLAKTDEWKNELGSNALEDTFAVSKDAVGFLEGEFQAYRATLNELGLTKVR